MFKVSILHPELKPRSEVIHATAALIGKAAHCQLRLPGWKVARQHARIYRSRSGLFIQDLGQFFGTSVNGARIREHGPLAGDDRICIGLFTLQVEDQLCPPAPAAAAEMPVAPAAAVTEAVSAPLPLPAANTAPQHYWHRHLHESLLEAIDLRRRDFSELSDAALRSEAESLLRTIIAAEEALPEELDHEQLLQAVLDEALGLGPLEALLADRTVSEIMVNGHEQIYLERHGRLEVHPACFTSTRAVLDVIERIVTPLGRRIDEASPMVDARLADGSRVHAIIPPLALNGPTLTIRKFARQQLHAADLVARGSFSAAMATFLQCCVEQRRNLLVAGGTGTGKTTLLNLLSGFIAHGERIITIEDAAELQLAHPHLVRLEARPPNAEGRGAISIRELLRNALRMRPDRIIVGECRGGEALDMLQAMNTGHDGSLTTIHASSARDALARLETLVLMAGMELPLSAVREQIAAAIDVIVQLVRLADGRRVVSSIVEVTACADGCIQTQELFRFQPRGRTEGGNIDGIFVGCNTVPAFYEELIAAGARPDLSLFEAHEQ